MRYFLEIVFIVFTATFVGAQRQGDLCVVAATIQPGVCRHILRCSVVLEAAFNGLPYQVCASPENRLIVCCPWVPGQETRLQARCQANTTTPREGDNCTMVDTEKAGVCSQFGNCPTAIEAASKGKFPQVCAVEGPDEIVCCPLVIVAEGDQCTLAATGRAGKCLRITKCPVAMEAALKGMTPQICSFEGSVPVVCCEGWLKICALEDRFQIVCCPSVTVIEGDNYTVVDAGSAGVCRPFATCQTAKEAASKGFLPQMCDVEGAVQTVCCPLSTVVEGDNCTVVDTGKAGVCKPFANCQTAKEAAYTGILPQTCDVEGSDQIVCCALVTFVEGSHCTLKRTGIAGVCRPFANCHTAKEAAYKGIFQQKCDLTDNESELVCCVETNCPPLPKGLVTQLPTGSKAADYCIELAQKIHPCQETRSGWTRGDMCPLLTPDSNVEYHNTPMTTTAEASYYGQIGSGLKGNIIWERRPVSLVSDQWVLCSAWAIERIGSDKVKFVGLGGTFTPRYNPDEIYGVTKQYIHPLYNTTYSKAYNSIALLQLDREVKFTSRILPACLHTGTPLPDSGFILTAPEFHSKTDYKTSMQRVSQEECSKVFSAATSSSLHPAGIKHDVEICSRPVNTTGECVDWYSGPPLTLPNSHRVACTHLLVGLGSSWTRSSCTFTNTRISAFIPWIEGIVWPDRDVIV